MKRITICLVLTLCCCAWSFAQLKPIKSQQINKPISITTLSKTSPASNANSSNLSNSSTAHDHRTCGSDAHHAEMMQDPDYAKKYNELQAHVSAVTANKSLPACNTPLIIPVSEKELSELIYDRTGNNRHFGLIRSKGDLALFGRTTQQMKTKLGVPKNRPLADFLPTITIKAKDFATEITVFNTKEKNLRTEHQISKEHITNNTSVRKILLERDIVPENLPPEEDIRKLERRVNKETKKIGKNPDKLN